MSLIEQNACTTLHKLDLDENGVPRYNAVILRYDEIALKGGNRNVFEQRLIKNCRDILRTEEMAIALFQVRGRIWFTKKERTCFTPAEWSAVQRAMSRLFGLASYSPCLLLEPDWDSLLPLLTALTCERLTRTLAHHAGELTFRLRARRADKRFPLESREIERAVVDALPETLHTERIRLDLNHAEVTIGVEIRNEMAFVWDREFEGPGGLPVGANEPVLALLSGGIDSPVAAYRLMKRGCRCDFLTFDSYPYTPPDAVEKVKRLKQHLDCFQNNRSKLYICNLAPIQKQIRDTCESRYRTVLYRRMMMRIASALGKRFHYGALVTGEAVGQVASQTVTNLNTIEEAASLAVLRPLCGMDKKETIAQAEKIGTFLLSKVPVPDSCTVFAPDSPATCAKLYQIREEEAKLGDLEPLIQSAIAAIELYPAKHPESEKEPPAYA